MSTKIEKLLEKNEVSFSELHKYLQGLAQNLYFGLAYVTPEDGSLHITKNLEELPEEWEFLGIACDDIIFDPAPFPYQANCPLTAGAVRKWAKETPYFSDKAYLAGEKEQALLNPRFADYADTLAKLRFMFPDLHQLYPQEVLLPISEEWPDEQQITPQLLWPDDGAVRAEYRGILRCYKF